MLTVLTILALAGDSPQTTDPPAADPLPALIDTWCIECHGGPRPKARLHLGSLATMAAAERDLQALERIHEMLVTGEMPPEGKPRPAADELAAAIAYLQSTIAEREQTQPPADPHRAPAAPGHVTMRRLNRVEYENTIRDLLGVDFDASSFLPADDVGHGFDNIGDVLSMPPLLFEKYLDAAERIASRAYADPAPPGGAMRRVPGSQLRGEGRSLHVRGEGHFLSTTGTVSVAHEFPIDSRYRLSIEAAGQQAGPEVVKVALAIDGRTIETFEVPATYDAPAAYTIETHIDAGEHRVGASFINDYYRADDPDPAQRDRNCGIFAIVIEGPLDAAATRQQAHGTPDAEQVLREHDPDRWVRQTVEFLTTRAFRRPATQADVRDLMEVAGAEGTPEARVRAAITAMLVSPRFLFRPEASSGEARQLDGYEIASRLSYFIWSSTPDDALLAAAGKGELDTPEGVVAHADRMLDDPRSIALAQNFATQWLQVRDLERRTPDPDRYPEVSESLLGAMKAETILLFDAIVREDREVRDLLDCDFTFLNEALAKHYGIPGVRGEYMRRVRLPEGFEGGVISHASVLTATSNPNRTSPVKRGKWVLEAILDEPPPPPPPGVASFEKAKEDAGGGTVREIMARHRADPNCSVCHRTMDALGFALEEFDPVGRFRLTDNGLPIDSLGELPGGRAVEGAGGLRALLLEDAAAKFRRSLATHLLTYALGRGVTEADEATIDRLAESTSESPTIPALVRAIVQTDAFRRGGA